MTGEVLFDGKQSLFRGLWTLIPAFALGCFSLYTFAEPAPGDPTQPLVGAGLGLAALLVMLRIPRDRLVVRDGRFEIDGLLGSTRIDFSSVQSLGFSRLAGGEINWGEGAYVHTSQGTVPVCTYADAAGLWKVLEDKLVPLMADRIVHDLEAGRTVTLTGAVLEPKGFTILGTRGGWHELDRASLGKDGLLVTLRDRPQDAITTTAAKLPDLPVILRVVRTMEAKGTPGEKAEPDAGGSDRPVSDVPLPGLPPLHPELGALVFTRTIPASSTALLWFLGISGVATLIGCAACAMDLRVGGSDPEALGGVPFAFFMVGVILCGIFDLATGDAFSVYEKGIANTQKLLKWADCTGLTLAATEHYTNGAYTHTAYSATASGGGVSFTVDGQGPKIEAYWRWFKEKLAPMLATRDLETITQGGEVRYGSLTLTKDHLSYQGGQVPWSDYHSHQVQQGWLYIFTAQSQSAVFSLALSEPNAHVLWLLLLLFEDSRRQA